MPLANGVPYSKSNLLVLKSKPIVEAIDPLSVLPVLLIILIIPAGPLVV
jgi:hypothetical protein